MDKYSEELPITSNSSNDSERTNFMKQVSNWPVTMTTEIKQDVHTMPLFSGFNGFGQFGCRSGKLKAGSFQSISALDDRLSRDVPILVSCSWSYTAYAVGRNLLFKGLIRDLPETHLFFSTCNDIKQIAACERICLILLNNGKLLKINPKSDSELQEVSCEQNRIPQKRSLFGKPTGRIKFDLVAVGSNITVGISDTNAIFSIPSQISQLPKHVRIKQLVCGFEHALILSGNGDVYSWGNGIRAQLGSESMKIEEEPILVEALAGIKITCIAAGGWHSAAISVFGDLYTWGFNSNGQLGLRLFKSSGLKTPSVYPLPQLIDLPECCQCNANDEEGNAENCTPLKVFAGARHTILQMSCGSLLAVGWNKYGQLGLSGIDDQCDSFRKISFQTKLEKDVNVVCGPWCTVLLSDK